MRLAALALVLLAPGFAHAGELQVVMQTPASISISAWCKQGDGCSQAVANRAQAHCAVGGRNAQSAGPSEVVERSFFDGDKVMFRFNCAR